MQTVGNPGSYGLEQHRLRNLRTAYWNLSSSALIEQALLRGEGALSSHGALCVQTGKFTGRSPNDKYIARSGRKADHEIWWGKVNHPIPAAQVERLYEKMSAYLQGRDVFVMDLRAGADRGYAISLRLVTEKAWTALFAKNLFIRPEPEDFTPLIPDYTILHCPDFYAEPEIDKTTSSTFVILDFQRKLVLIGGTSYAGEVKKAIFSVMNYLLPKRGVFPMHCSTNIGRNGDVALFFGLSGTGKTTLSSDPERVLVGDDEHGWSDTGIFNFEGGCYAKTVHLRPDLEPLIWQAAQRYGSVLENVTLNEQSRLPDFDDTSLTENTRAAYPLQAIPSASSSGNAGHPRNVFFLSADAFGVLPPLARLTTEQAMYYFLSGYTAKLAGTERGLGKEPQATFSTCFGAPFLPLPPIQYAMLLREKIQRHQARVWLVNTGWTGGGYGQGGRIALAYTRASIKAVLDGTIDSVQFIQEPTFHFWIPETCPGVPDRLLNPVRTWESAAQYQETAGGLIQQFEENFAQFIEPQMDANLLELTQLARRGSPAYQKEHGGGG